MPSDRVDGSCTMAMMLAASAGVTLCGRGREVRLRCRLDAVVVAAEVGDVEVLVQNLLLRELLLEADGEPHLLELA